MIPHMVPLAKMASDPIPEEEIQKMRELAARYHPEGAQHMSAMAPAAPTPGDKAVAESVARAEAAGVEPHKILRSTADLDAWMNAPSPQGPHRAPPEPKLPFGDYRDEVLAHMEAQEANPTPRPRPTSFPDLPHMAPPPAAAAAQAVAEAAPTPTKAPSRITGRNVGLGLAGAGALTAMGLGMRHLWRKHKAEKERQGQGDVGQAG